MIGKVLSSVSASPWWPVAKLGLAVLAVGLVWLHGRASGTESERKGWEAKVAAAQQQRIQTYEATLTKFRQQAAVDQETLRSLGLHVLALETEHKRLERVKVPVVLRKEVPSEKGKCFDSRLSRAFGVCASAAVSGSPTDTTACQTAASDAATGTVTRF